MLHDLPAWNVNTKWSIKIIPRAFSLSLFLPPPPPRLLLFILLPKLSHSDWSAYSQSAGYSLCLLPFSLFSPSPFFSQFILLSFSSTKRPCSDIFPGLPCTSPPISYALFPSLFPLLGALFVNVKRRRMREQIMKHRSAFHTLFRKNSPTAQRGRGATSPLRFYPHFQSIWVFLCLQSLGVSMILGLTVL